MEKTTLKLIIEKGPRAGETLENSSTSIIKIGRVVTCNTFAIKDSGISSKHLCIQFHNQWTLCDLDSSNGTLLNAQLLKPYAPSALNHGDRIKIGELTSILVNIQAESMLPQRRNTRRRQGKCKPQSQSQLDDDVGELGLGFDGEKEGKQAVKKRNLRSAVKKDMVDSSDRRLLTSVKKEAVSFLVPEDVPENVDVSVQVEPKKTRGRRRKRTVEEVLVDADLDKRKAADVVVVVGPVVGRMTRARRRLLLENAETDGLEKKLNNVDGSLQLGEVKDSGLGENLGVDDVSAAENQECCDGKGVMADGSSLKGKGVVEESECMKDGGDNDRWKDLEKMTLGDFFDYLEVQLPKEIYDKSEKIISDLEEKARKCHEFRLQRNEPGKGKLVTE